MKRATYAILVNKNNPTISIHALVKRATKVKIDSNGKVIDFNPRPREEGDSYLPLAYLAYEISIHALVKRATFFVAFSQSTHFAFQSTPS